MGGPPTIFFGKPGFQLEPDGQGDQSRFLELASSSYWVEALENSFFFEILTILALNLTLLDLTKLTSLT